MGYSPVRACSKAIGNQTQGLDWPETIQNGRMEESDFPVLKRDALLLQRGCSGTKVIQDDDCWMRTESDKAGVAPGNEEGRKG